MRLHKVCGNNGLAPKPCAIHETSSDESFISGIHVIFYIFISSDMFMDWRLEQESRLHYKNPLEYLEVKNLSVTTDVENSHITVLLIVFTKHCFVVTQDRMYGSSNETWNPKSWHHAWRLESNSNNGYYNYDFYKLL